MGLFSSGTEEMFYAEKARADRAESEAERLRAEIADQRRECAANHVMVDWGQVGLQHHKAAEGVARLGRTNHKSEAEAIDRLVVGLSKRAEAAESALASARDLHEKSMAFIHETAGVRRDGLAGITGWILDTKDALASAQARIGELEAALALSDAVLNPETEAAHWKRRFDDAECEREEARESARVATGRIAELEAEVLDAHAGREHWQELGQRMQAERDRLRKALELWGPRVCGFNCRPEDPEHERFCSAWEANAAVKSVLAGGGT